MICALYQFTTLALCRNDRALKINVLYFFSWFKQAVMTPILSRNCVPTQVQADALQHWDDKSFITVL